jgi:hypothetical protein
MSKLAMVKNIKGSAVVLRNARVLLGILLGISADRCIARLPLGNKTP